MANHTPGPWKARMNCDVMAGERLVADCMTGWLREDRANARLVAAAPEMLDMLIELQECSNWNTLVDIAERLDAVISKAKGE